MTRTRAVIPTFGGRRTVETITRLRVADLRSAGLLRSGSNDQPVRLALGPGSLEVSGRQVSADALDLTWRAGRRDRTVRVRIAWVDMTFGQVPYFVCPVMGARCTALFYAEQGWGSRRAMGLAYRSQALDRPARAQLKLEGLIARLQGEAGKAPARGANRARLIEAARHTAEALSDHGIDCWALLGVLDQHATRRSKPKRIRPRRSDSPMLTRSALRLGRTQPPRLKSREIVAQLRALDPVGPTEPWSAAGADTLPTPIDRCPELDIRALKPKAGFARGHKLNWPATGDMSELTLLAYMDTEDEQNERLVLARLDTGGNLSIAQVIRVVGGARPGDRFLICPVTGRRHLKLYYRQGRFAYPPAQRLDRG